MGIKISKSRYVVKNWRFANNFHEPQRNVCVSSSQSVICFQKPTNKWKMYIFFLFTVASRNLWHCCMCLGNTWGSQRHWQILRMLASDHLPPWARVLDESFKHIEGWWGFEIIFVYLSRIELIPSPRVMTAHAGCSIMCVTCSKIFSPSLAWQRIS